MTQPVRIGVVGGGLMGKELLALTGRWNALVDHPVRPEIVALADPAPAVQRWWERAGVPAFDDYRRLLDDPAVDVLYLAVPHDLHERLYLDAISAGKDFLGEKPFGIDLAAATAIHAAVEASCFVRVCSELPYFPGALRALELVRSGALGDVLEVRSGLWHSSDLDRAKPINWKRRASTCGELGVMGDLGMHVAHLPLRLGWRPDEVYALLDDVVRERPGSDGAMVPCDTWDNAVLATKVAGDSGRRFPMLWETKRIAPGHSNTWFFEAYGMDGGVRFSTRTPQTLQLFSVLAGQQAWSEVQPGHRSAWPTVTGPIFEFGFPDALLQMWAAFLAERAGALGDRFATASPAEALAAHRIFAAALQSHDSGNSIELSDL